MDHSSLRQAINGLCWSPASARGTRNVYNDAASLVLEHLSPCCLQGKERTLEVDVHQEVVGFFCDIQHRFKSENTSIVYQDIDASVLFSNGRDGGADTCDISHVHVHKVTASRCSDFLEALHVDVSKDDGVAVCCHRRTKCLSDSTRSTRYNYNSSHQMFLTELCPLLGMRINRLEMAAISHAWYRASCSLADLTGIGVGCNRSQKRNRCRNKPPDVCRIGIQKSRNIGER